MHGDIDIDIDIDIDLINDREDDVADLASQRYGAAHIAIAADFSTFCPTPARTDMGTRKNPSRTQPPDPAPLPMRWRCG